MSILTKNNSCKNIPIKTIKISQIYITLQPNNIVSLVIEFRKPRLVEHTTWESSP